MFDTITQKFPRDYTAAYTKILIAWLNSLLSRPNQIIPYPGFRMIQIVYNLYAAWSREHPH